jgi:hypothetical protein
MSFKEARFTELVRIASGALAPALAENLDKCLPYIESLAPFKVYTFIAGSHGQVV